MKIYKLNISVYDYWKTSDCGGFVHEEKYFLNKEGAEKWAAEHPKYAHAFGSKEARNEYEMPKYEIEKIEVIE